MQNPVSQYLSGVGSVGEQGNLRAILEPLADRLSCTGQITSGLVIKVGASAIVKSGAAAWYGVVQGKLVTKAASTDMPALAGTVTNAKFNVYCFFIDTAGTITAAMGTEGATLGTVKFPSLPAGKTLFGYIIVNPTGTGNFVGGTTALDDATVAPNVVYIGDPRGVDPSVVLS